MIARGWFQCGLVYYLNFEAILILKQIYIYKYSFLANQGK